jgi:hypothetical protein
MTFSKTINRDVLLKVASKDVVKKVEQLFMVRWSIIYIHVSFHYSELKRQSYQIL